MALAASCHLSIDPSPLVLVLVLLGRSKNETYRILDSVVHLLT